MALWMQLVGLGLYMGYIPFNCIFFERMIATFKIKGNVGFLIYVADAFGYLGQRDRNVVKRIPGIKNELVWLLFVRSGHRFFIGIAGTIFSFIYFNKKYRSTKI